MDPQASNPDANPGVYTFISVGTDTVIDLQRSSPENGTHIINYRSHHGKNQKWQVAEAGHREYLILNDATGTYITAPESGHGQLTANLMSPTDGRVRWRMHRDRNGNYEVESAAFPGRVVDNARNSSDDSTPIILYERNGGANQQWRLE